MKDALLGPIVWLAVGSHIGFLILGGRIPIMVPDTADAAASEGSGEDSEMVPLFATGDDSVLPVLPWSVAMTSLTLLFFFAVFYSNDCYQRFKTLYGHTVGLAAATQEWSLLVRTYSRAEGPDIDRAAVFDMRWNASRYMLVALHLLYYTLYGSDTGPALSEIEWRMMRARQLVTHDEIAKVDAYVGFKPLLPLFWAMREARALIDDWSSARADRHGDLGQCMRDEHVLTQFREVVFKFRGHCGQIINLLKQPIPFPYFHLLNVMLVIQLFLLSYALATYADLPFYMSIASITIVSIVLVGLRSLSVQLSNPFGDDLVDFNIEEFMHREYKNVLSMLTTELHAPHSKVLPQGLSNPLLTALDGAPAGAALAKGRRGKGGAPVLWGKGPTRIRQWPDDPPAEPEVTVAAQNL